MSRAEAGRNAVRSALSKQADDSEQGPGKGCKWEVRLAAVDGLIPPGDPQGLEVGAREKRAKPRETTRIKKPGFVLS